MANELNRQTLVGLLGNKAGTKLYNWLDGCCDTFCEDVQACAAEEGLVRVLIGNGTAALPSLAFVNSPTTGIYRSAADLIGFSAAGASIGSWGATQLSVVGDIAGSGNLLITDVVVSGGVRDAGSTFFAGFYPLGAPQALAGPGVVNLTAFQTQFTSTGTGDALTLADSTQVGQLKKISYVAEAAGADTGVLTLTGYTSITFNAVGDYAVVLWDGSAWAVVEYAGVTIV